MWAVPIIITEFLVIILFSYIFIVYGIKIFPVSGIASASPSLHNAGFALYLDIAWHMCLPVACLVMAGLGPWVLYTKNMMSDALSQDYIFYTARAKGLSRKVILFKHAFKSILPQISTMITIAVPTIIAGSMITEALFGIDGIGNWYIKIVYADTQIIRFTDPAVTQAVFFIYAHIVIALNFIADLLYAVFDPRIRVGTRK
jgi:peptide/nickel transport system permease protein